MHRHNITIVVVVVVVVVVSVTYLVSVVHAKSDTRGLEVKDLEGLCL